MPEVFSQHPTHATRPTPLLSRSAATLHSINERLYLSELVERCTAQHSTAQHSS